MASETFLSGPWSALFIAAASSVTPMTLVPLETTGPYIFTEEIPKSYIPATGKYEQAGAKTINLSLSFLSLDDTAIKIARGLALDASTVYGTPTGQQYMLLLVDGEDFSSNLYIPCCESTGPFSFNRDKNNQTQVSLQMQYQAPDLNTLLWAVGDFATLEPLIGSSAWPF